MLILQNHVLVLFLSLAHVSFQEHPLQQSDLRKAIQENNFSHHHLIQTLRDHGYVIKEFPNRSPLAFVGDIAYEPQQILSELSEGRVTAFITKKNWIDPDGSPHARYFFDSESKPKKEIFKNATQTWINSTCIRFEKLPDGPCKQNLTYPAICVGAFEGCWSHIGTVHPEGGEPQQMSIEEGCWIPAAAHEFGHALGSKHFHSRPDRDKFITVNNENYSLMPNKGDIESLVSKWRQGMLCDRDQVVDLPVPYDYLSLMHYSTDSFGDDDHRGILITKDVRHQYMLNYHFEATQLQSHYDLYTVNVIYGCVKIWKDACVKNGKSPPKCQNLGYLAKNCKCICPKGFDGAACEKKTGSIYPLMPKAKVLVEVHETKVVDLTEQTMSVDYLDGPPGFFGSFQFLTVIVDGKDPNTQVGITVIQNVNKCKLLMKDFRENIAKDLSHQDCTYLFYWGLSSLGHMRAECFSTVANNEPEGPWFRSRTNHLDISAQSCFGYLYSSTEMTIELIQLKMSVVFAPRPGKLLKVDKKNPGWVAGVAGAAARMVGAVPAGLAAGGWILAVVPLVAVVLVLVYRYKVKKKAEVEEADGSSSSSQDAEEGSASGDESKSNTSKDGVDDEKGEDQDGDEKKDEDQDDDKKKDPNEKEKTSEEEDPSKQQEQGILSKLPSLW